MLSMRLFDPLALVCVSFLPELINLKRRKGLDCGLVHFMVTVLCYDASADTAHCGGNSL